MWTYTLAIRTCYGVVAQILGRWETHTPVKGSYDDYTALYHEVEYLQWRLEVSFLYLSNREVYSKVIWLFISGFTKFSRTQSQWFQLRDLDTIVSDELATCITTEWILHFTQILSGTSVETQQKTTLWPINIINDEVNVAYSYSNFIRLKREKREFFHGYSSTPSF